MQSLNWDTAYFAMMMSLQITPPTLIVLLIVNGVGAQYGWVSYYPKYICALKGSTVIMGCNYFYPADHTFKSAFWTKSLPLSTGEPPDLLDDTEYRDRVQYLRDKQHDCRLSLKDVRESDQSKYYFRFITDKEGGKYTGTGGVYLSVTGLQVEGPERVMEGDKVTLTCKTTCRLTDSPSFTWYRNGTTLSSSTEQLYLQSVSREDAGRYNCSVLDLNLRSTEVTLNVLYPPKSISVSISPSGKIVEGSSVTLTCSSDGEPPVEYTWYKGSSSVAAGKTFTLNKISSVNSGEYKCRSSNKHGEKYSDTVTLNVLYPPKSVSVSISPSGEIVEGSSVTLTCSSDGNPPVEYTWYDGSSSVALGKTFTLNKISSVNSGEYKCRSSNKHGEKYSDNINLNVLYPPKCVSVFISPSGEIVEGGSVTLTCSSDGNPPVQKYTWFKKVDKDVQQKWTGQIYSITNIRSADSGEYQCMATNTQGSQSSEYKSLTVLHPPKNILVSISPSGKRVEGSSVTLTCSSDGNPPVQKYTWFKIGGSSPVGSGHSYSFNLDSESSGQYYCEAQNEHGSKISEAVLLSFKRNLNVTLYITGGVLVGCVGLILVPVILFIRKKNKRRKKREHDYQNANPNAQDDTYTALNPMSRSSNDVYDTLNANTDPNAQDDTYTALNPMTRSSNDVYDTIATVHSSRPGDAYTALDPQSRSPEYQTLAETEFT